MSDKEQIAALKAELAAMREQRDQWIKLIDHLREENAELKAALANRAN